MIQFINYRTEASHNSGRDIYFAYSQKFRRTLISHIHFEVHHCKAPMDEIGSTTKNSSTFISIPKQFAEFMLVNTLTLVGLALKGLSTLSVLNKDRLLEE